MGREITRTGYSTLGSVALLAAMACLGAASVAVQLGSLGWWIVGIVLVAATVVLLWQAVRCLKRGRMNPPGQDVYGSQSDDYPSR